MQTPDHPGSLPVCFYPTAPPPGLLPLPSSHQVEEREWGAKQRMHRTTAQPCITYQLYRQEMSTQRGDVSYVECEELGQDPAL